MTHFQIILLHHDPSLVYSVLDQFEDGVMDQQKKQYDHKEFDVIQSKRKLASFIATISVLNADVSKVIVDFAPPPLVVMNENHYGNDMSSENYVLSFYDHYVEFDRVHLVSYCSQNFKSCKYEKTIFIQLFDEKEAPLLLLSIDEMAKIYGFLTRLFGASFETSHQIHLFARHKRADTDGIQYEEENDGKTQRKADTLHLCIKSNHNELKDHDLVSISSLKILSHLLSTIIHKNKVPPMVAMYSLISKIRLRLNVVREIRSCIDPMRFSSDKCISDLVNHILTSNHHNTYSALRTSYVHTQ